jgi:putative ATP-binding cassette transporter
MKLVAFLLRHSPRPALLAIAAGAAAGLGSIALLALISRKISDPAAATSTRVWAFVAITAAVCLMRFVSEVLLARLGQGAILGLRMRLSRQILVAPLRDLERLGAHRLLASLTDDVLSIASALILVPALFINLAVVAGCLIYLSWLSGLALLLIVAFTVVGVVGYYLPLSRGVRSLRKAREEQDTLFEVFRGLINGAKELKLHEGRGEDFLARELYTAANAFRRHNVAGVTTYVAAATFGQFLFFILVGLLLVIMPAAGEGDRQLLAGSALALFYMMPSLQLILNVLPALGRGDVALQKVEALGLSLAALPAEGDAAQAAAPARGWRRLELLGVTHTYRSEGSDHDFTLGPLDVTFAPGEIVFLTGGNGSGKTTFAKLLTGLYTPEAGEIRLDGRPVTADSLASYRQNFSAVFADFHLFSRLLAPEQAEVDERARQYLSKLKLDGKVRVEGGRLSTSELSQGQRKRLALLAAYMEDRPFYVFDEWAADQDPQFKETFYRQLLPELKAAGKTALVISHDDHYYHVADRLIKLNYGRAEFEKLMPHHPLDQLPAGEVVPTASDPAPALTPHAAEWQAARPTPAAAPAVLLPRRRVFALALLLLLPLLAFFVIERGGPPAPVPADAPAHEFSSARALEHLRVIARTAHPVGSAAHEAAREYLLGRLRGMGLEPEVQEAPGVRALGTNVRAATTRNVVVRLKGTSSTGAVMLVGHYDTVPVSPGASDAGSAVAALLETLRALRTGPPMRNDLIFLFSDGEELGLLGAQAFVERHPWAAEVGLVLNFEARGNRGASAMFETDDRNRWLVAELARAAPRSVSNSLLNALYRLLPNETDMTVFRRAGLRGLNFAYAEGLVYYHTSADSLENIDEGSLQHQGSYALSLARHFGALDLREQAPGEAVYFDLFGALLLHYPKSWAVPLAAVAALLYLCAVGYGWRRKSLRPGALALGFAAPLLAAVSAAVLVLLTWTVIRLLQPGYARFVSGDLYQSPLYQTSFVLLAAAAAALTYAFLTKKLGLHNGLAGGLLWWLSAALGTALLLPGGSYLFTWPLLFSALGLFVALRARAQSPDDGSSFAALCLSGLPGLVLLTQTFHLLFTLTGMQLPAALVFVLVLFSGVLAPCFVYVSALGGRLVPGACALAALVLIVAALAASGARAQAPWPDSVFYGLNADAGRAVWVSTDAAPDEWTSQFFAGGARRGSAADFYPPYDRSVLQADAPALPLPAPSATVLEDTTRGDVRTIRLRIDSPRRASTVSAYLAPGTEVLSTGVAGRVLAHDESPRPGQSPRPWRMVYTAPPEGGFELVLEVRPGPLKLRLVDQTGGLPDLPGMTVKARPPHLVPSSADATLVSKSFDF